MKSTPTPRRPRRPQVDRLLSLWLAPLLAFSVQTQALPEGTAQSAGGYSLDRYTIDAGGGDSSGSGFVLRGSIGEPDVNASGPATGGNYEISGGFRGAGGSDRIFANGFDSR